MSCRKEKLITERAKLIVGIKFRKDLVKVGKYEH